MPGFDKQKFAHALRTNALPPFGIGKCATYVRLALEAAGLSTDPHPPYAKEWGPTLERLGFTTVSQTGYTPQTGDIIVMQQTSACIYGHMEGYDGSNWVSDFVQRELWPGPSFRAEKPAYAIYRSAI